MNKNIAKLNASTNLVNLRDNRISTMSDYNIDIVKCMQEDVLSLPQVSTITEQSLHAGVYTRTVLMEKDTVWVGALVKRSTNLIISGHILVILGEEHCEYEGYATIHASANRKQGFVAIEDTYLTMFFATDATTVEQAEAEFTDDHELLVTRQEGSINHITITGE